MIDSGLLGMDGIRILQDSIPNYLGKQISQKQKEENY